MQINPTANDGVTPWPGTQPTLSGNSYSVTYNNPGSVTAVFGYTVNVSSNEASRPQPDFTGGNDPVIENQGGGGSGTETGPRGKQGGPLNRRSD